MDVKKLVFIDETWASTSMTRRYGRAPRGQRCIGSAPHGHWKTTTFVGGLRHDRLTAPMVTDEPMDGEMFLAWVQQFLCPTLESGDIVWSPSSHRRGRRNPALSATLLARSQPHRKALLQTQDAAPQSRQTIRRSPMDRDRRTARHHRTGRMRQLLRLVRICIALN